MNTSGSSRRGRGLLLLFAAMQALIGLDSSRVPYVPEWAKITAYTISAALFLEAWLFGSRAVIRGAVAVGIALALARAGLYFLGDGRVTPLWLHLQVYAALVAAYTASGRAVTLSVKEHDDDVHSN